MPQNDLVCPLRDCGKHLRSQYGFDIHEQEHQRLIDEGLELADFDFSLYEKPRLLRSLIDRNQSYHCAPPTESRCQLNDSHVLIQLNELLLRKGRLLPRKCSKIAWW